MHNEQSFISQKSLADISDLQILVMQLLKFEGLMTKFKFVKLGNAFFQNTPQVSFNV